MYSKGNRIQNIMYGALNTIPFCIRITQKIIQLQIWPEVKIGR